MSSSKSKLAPFFREEWRKFNTVRIANPHCVWVGMFTGTPYNTVCPKHFPISAAEFHVLTSVGRRPAAATFKIELDGDHVARLSANPYIVRARDDADQRMQVVVGRLWRSFGHAVANRRFSLRLPTIDRSGVVHSGQCAGVDYPPLAVVESAGAVAEMTRAATALHPAATPADVAAFLHGDRKKFSVADAPVIMTGIGVTTSMVVTRDETRTHWILDLSALFEPAVAPVVTPVLV